MKTILIVCFGFILISCKTYQSMTNDNREKLNKININMSKDEVLKIMGTEPVRVMTSYLGTSQKILNPFKREIYKDNEKIYEVLYYCTQVKELDGNITDDELTPLVFEDDVLIGWGWTFIDSKVIDVRVDSK